jgi:hypothetical protein
MSTISGNRFLSIQFTSPEESQYFVLPYSVLSGCYWQQAKSNYVGVYLEVSGFETQSLTPRERRTYIQKVYQQGAEDVWVIEGKKKEGYIRLLNTGIKGSKSSLDFLVLKSRRMR